jgi:hypothetical protein
MLCLNFYIGIAGTTGQGDSPARDVLAVKDMDDFLEGDFEDLVIPNKSGLMSPFGSSLHLVERARKKLEEKALEKDRGIWNGDKGRIRVRRNKYKYKYKYKHKREYRDRKKAGR